jgi:hypothetical protein
VAVPPCARRLGDALARARRAQIVFVASAPAWRLMRAYRVVPLARACRLTWDGPSCHRECVWSPRHRASKHLQSEASSVRLQTVPE